MELKYKCENCSFQGNSIDISLIHMSKTKHIMRVNEGRLDKAEIPALSTVVQDD